MRHRRPRRPHRLQRSPSPRPEILPSPPHRRRARFPPHTRHRVNCYTISNMTRRTLLLTPLALAAASPARLPIKKAVEFNMLPTAIPVLDRFQLARDSGFEEIECPTTP